MNSIKIEVNGLPELENAAEQIVTFAGKEQIFIFDGEMGAGKTTLIPHQTAIKTREFIANDLAAWASFQPLFDMISEKEPDLLD